MREANANLWACPADIRVITTNGDVNTRGAAVMGAGVALQAKEQYFDIEYEFGYMLIHYGNKVMWLRSDLLTFPVKHHWKDCASLDLIRRSSFQIQALANRIATEQKKALTIAMPRPGCGNGGLQWEAVRPLLVDVLSDWFVITHLTPEPV